MFKFISHLKFLMIATNQHGVHSPFVYDYVTKCLYAKPKYKASKSLDALLKSIPFFSVKDVKWDSGDQKGIAKTLQEYEVRINEEGPYDLIYIEHPTSELTAILTKNKEQIHNDTLLLIDHIHQNRANNRAWHDVRQNETVRVSIDLFHCGILFFRKEQEKEHFKIRI